MNFAPTGHSTYFIAAVAFVSMSDFYNISITLSEVLEISFSKSAYILQQSIRLVLLHLTAVFSKVFTLA